MTVTHKTEQNLSRGLLSGRETETSEEGQGRITMKSSRLTSTPGEDLHKKNVKTLNGGGPGRTWWTRRVVESRRRVCRRHQSYRNRESVYKDVKLENKDREPK